MSDDVNLWGPTSASNGAITAELVNNSFLLSPLPPSQIWRSKDVSIENEVEARKIFSMVWQSIGVIFLSRELTVYNSRHSRHQSFVPIVAYIINVGWWKHHQTKLPIARISANMYCLVCRYTLSTLEVIWPRWLLLGNCNFITGNSCPHIWTDSES
jgi:hypothetical protein